MKIIISFFTISLLFFLSCNEYLEDIKPSDNLAIDEAFTSAKDIETALAGVYNSLQSRNLSGETLFFLSDALSGNFTAPRNNASNQELADFALRSSNIYPMQFWTEAYKAINLANRILEALETVEDLALTDDLKKRIKGEALFIRGILHFELVRFYAFPYNETRAASDLGVPIMLTSVLIKGEIQYPVQATVEEVYVQVEKDILEAKNLLPLPGQTQQGKANQYAALAYLARIAFQKHDYTNAAKYAKDLLETDLELNVFPWGFFRNDSSAEEIWVISNSSSDSGFRLYGYHPGGFPQTPFSKDLRENGFKAVIPDFQQSAIQDAGFQVIDLRIFAEETLGSIPVDPLITEDTLNSFKYESFGTGEDDAPMARLAEFHLMRAEALVESDGINDESVLLLNEIRRRSLRTIDGSGEVVEGMESLFDYKTTDFQNAEELIAAIVVERRVELCLEGNYYHDVMRRKSYVVNPGNGDIYNYNDCKLRLPIPQAERDANPNLKDECY